MQDDLQFNEMEIVGTTTSIDDLPRRLSPVYLRRGSQGPYYVTVNEDGAPRPILSMEESEDFDEMVLRGDAVRFSQALPARPGYHLVQFKDGSPPEYVPADELPNRLCRACREALERAASALSKGRRDTAESYAWYARRASEDDPLPLLLLLALLRDVLPSGELGILEQDLAEYSPAHVESARRRARERSELTTIGDLLEESPASGVRLKYLSGYRQNPSFLSKIRKRLTANAGRRM